MGDKNHNIQDLFLNYLRKEKIPVLKISSVSGENLNKLKDMIWEKLKEDGE